MSWYVTTVALATGDWAHYALPDNGQVLHGSLIGSFPTEYPDSLAPFIREIGKETDGGSPPPSYEHVSEFGGRSEHTRLGQ